MIAMTWAVGLAAVLVGRIAGARAGRWAGLFAACAFLPVRYAAEVRSYAFVALLVTACWYCVDRVLAGDARRGHWRAYGWCTVALPLFHGLAIIQVLVIGAVVLWARPAPDVRRRAVEAVRRDLADGSWDARHGHLRALDAYDAGLRLVVHEP